MKKRADLLILDKQLAESRTKAQALIAEGQIFINGNKVLKNEAANDTTGSSVAVNNNSSVVKTDHTNSPTTIIASSVNESAFANNIHDTI